METNINKRTTFLYFLGALGLFLFSTMLYGQDATSLFNAYSNRIYQIRIIEQATGKQAALGSGFQISHDGDVITNYHVVSEYISYPDKYRIEYVSNNGVEGELQLIDIDVINDLSLLRKDDVQVEYLELADSLPIQGESIYSIGNPHDLGLTVVPGTYNGIPSHSLYKRIHFSGSINPGMSGGPVLNSDGQVIGVNVSTAGNQISFLVPLERLVELVHRPRNGPIPIDAYKSTITEQLTKNQEVIINDLVNTQWLTSDFKGATIPNEIAGYIRCWGSSEDGADIAYENFASICSQDEYIFISGSFITGNIVYQFNWLESDELNSFQFYNLYESQIQNVGPDNYADKEDISNYVCQENFHAKDSNVGNEIVTKGTFCARKYKEYPGLYDVLYLGASLHDNHQGLVSHFTLAGVSMDMAVKFTEKFLSNITWN
ncbi:MAG: serine protease Do [Gammaproteobacteria bacterium]|jgi:serine protease Do